MGKELSTFIFLFPLENEGQITTNNVQKTHSCISKWQQKYSSDLSVAKKKTPKISLAFKVNLSSCMKRRFYVIMDSSVRQWDLIESERVFNCMNWHANVKKSEKTPWSKLQFIAGASGTGHSEWTKFWWIFPWFFVPHWKPPFFMSAVICDAAGGKPETPIPKHTRKETMGPKTLILNEWEPKFIHLTQKMTFVIILTQKRLMLNNHAEHQLFGN